MPNSQVFDPVDTARGATAVELGNMLRNIAQHPNDYAASTRRAVLNEAANRLAKVSPAPKPGEVVSIDQDGDTYVLVVWDIDGNEYTLAAASTETRLEERRTNLVDALASWGLFSDA